MVKKYSIPALFVIYIDQIPLKYAAASNQTMAAKNAKHVHVAGSKYKQAITGTFGIPFLANFLPMPLIYGEKTG